MKPGESEGKGVKMKRLDFIMNSISAVLGLVFVNCSVGMEEGSSGDRQQKTPERGSQSKPSGRRVSGPSDIKTLSTILQRAGCPLTENQINYLLTLKEGPEFSQKMGDVLDDRQIEAVKNASGGRGRRRR